MTTRRIAFGMFTLVLLSALLFSGTCLADSYVVPYNPQSDVVEVAVDNLYPGNEGHVAVVGVGDVLVWVNYRGVGSGWVNVNSYLKNGNNTLNFRVLVPKGGEYSYGFFIRKNRSIILKARCGSYSSDIPCGVTDWYATPYSKNFTVTFNGCSLRLSPSALPQGSVGTPYRAQMNVGGGTPPYAFQLRGAPQWLAISSSGLISGTPSSSGTFGLTVEVSDKTGCTASGSYSVVIAGSVVPGTGTKDVSNTSGIARQQVQTAGVQWIDFNGDRKMDLFLVGKNGNALFMNMGGGKFTNVTTVAHVENGNQSACGSASADIDNDGQIDLLIANTQGPPTILRNTNGVFSVVSNASGRSAQSSAGETMGVIWLDYDRDGRIDNYILKDLAPNQLNKNMGGFQFSDYGGTAHVAVKGPSRSAVSADFNGDGWPDIYLVKFRAPNDLFINQHDGTFLRFGGAAFSGASVQAIAGDYNNDGKVDLFVVNSQGPSVLYKNLGALKFQNVTAQAQLNQPVSGKAAAFGDFNRDGWLDLLLVQSNGPNILFQNNHNGTFNNAGSVDLNNPQEPTSLTLGDFNGDGRLDIMIGDGSSSETNGDSLYQNTTMGGHWLEAILIGTESNQSAIGATIQALAENTPHQQTVSGGTGSNQDSPVLFIGLGSATSLNELNINWPSGTRCTYYNCKADQRLTITEGAVVTGCQSWDSCQP